MKEKNESSWEIYLKTFDDIINNPTPPVPYDNPLYYDYLKLNRSRQNRWLKTGVITEKLSDLVKAISDNMTWYIITEPWCGDAAHSVPFLYKIAALNSRISVKIIWRDTPPFMIESYLTNGGKAVPKLVARNEKGEDVFTWGPRPAPCQEIFLKLKEKEADFEEQKITLQNWYNQDKGQTLQSEFEVILEEIFTTSQNSN